MESELEALRDLVQKLAAELAELRGDNKPVKYVGTTLAVNEWLAVGPYRVMVQGFRGKAVKLLVQSPVGHFVKFSTMRSVRSSEAERNVGSGPTS